MDKSRIVSNYQQSKPGNPHTENRPIESYFLALLLDFNLHSVPSEQDKLYYDLLVLVFSHKANIADK